MKQGFPPIKTIHLFPTLDAKLLELLRSLSEAEWNNKTLAKQWTVKDIAAHLLDGNIRTISMLRDGYFGETPGKINTYQDLVNFLNQLNADWVKATRRLSPALLIDFLEVTGKLFWEQLNKLDPFTPAIFSVDWAGQQESPNWFHIAREFTEKWHHQQQIREAVNRPGIMTMEFYPPLMETFMQALPHTYRNIEAEIGTFIQVKITTEIGGEWTLIKHQKNWALEKIISSHATAEIIIDPDTAWKLFTKGITGAEAETKIQFHGNVALGKPILTMLSVMA